MKNCQANWINFIPILIGLLVYFITAGPDHLNPESINWIRGGDGAQHYLGWTFFRGDVWRFPLGLNPLFGANISSSVVYSDSIPLFAILFKLLDPLLPTHFQYFGIWTLLCFILQAWFGWLLTGLCTKKLSLRSVGTGLFAFSIPMLFRLNLHAALTAHFFILASLYLCLTKSSSDRLPKWGILLSFSLATHFYIFAIIGVLWIASALDGYWSNRKPSLKQLTIEITSLTLLVSLVAWQTGYFASASNQTVLNHYGGFSPELFVFFNSNDWSYLLPKMYKATEEGTNFLGLGVILLLCTSLAGMSLQKIPLGSSVRPYPFLMAALLLLALIGFSNHVRIGLWEFNYPLPLTIQYALGSLRNSGRFLWPHMYLLTFASIYLVIRAYPKHALTILSICLLIQIGDSAIKWLPMRELISQSAKNPSIFTKATAALKDPFWENAAKQYGSVQMVPLREMSIQAFNKGEDWDWERFASYANAHRLSTNMAYLSRVDTNKIHLANQEYENRFKSGAWDAKTLYILDKEKIIPALIHLDREKDLLANIDGMVVLAPGWKNCSSCSPIPAHQEFQVNFKKPILSEKILFGKNGAGNAYLTGVAQFPQTGWGWGWPEDWGVWSEGREAHLALPVPTTPYSRLVLDINPLISPTHHQQRVIVQVNGNYHSLHTLNNENQIIDLALNPKALNYPAYLSIEFVFIDQIKPREIGMGSDDRILAIGLKSAVFQ